MSMVLSGASDGTPAPMNELAILEFTLPTPSVPVSTMPPKPNPLYCTALWVLLALAACVGRVLATPDSKTILASAATSYDVVDPNQVPRHLRVFRMEGGDDSSEERGAGWLTTALKKLAPDKQKTADKLFTRLKLHESTSNLLGNPKFKAWVSSVEKSYKKTPEAADVAMVLTMKTQFGDDGLAKLLLHAKGSPETREVATRLEGVQFKNWIESKQTATDAFKLLKLDQDMGGILKNPLVTTWMSYVELRKGSPIHEMLSQLKTRYNDGALARMFAFAKQDSTTSPIAGKLEETLVDGWVRQRKSANYMFQLLQLKREEGDLFTSPLLGTWVSYVTKRHESPYESMFTVLKAHYSDREISHMLAVAKRSGSTRDLATRLEKVRLIRDEANGGEASAQAFQQFFFDRKGEKLFENPEFVALARRLGEKVTLPVLKTHYTDERLEKILNVASRARPRNTRVVAVSLQLELWQTQRRSADEVFKLLKLEQAGDNVLRSPFLDVWVLYASNLGKIDKKVGEFAAISVLERRFGDSELAMMLAAARKDSALMSGGNGAVIDRLQQLQFKKWFKTGFTPKAVSDRPTYRHDPRGLNVVSGYRAFYDAIRAKGGLTSQDKYKPSLTSINERV